MGNFKVISDGTYNGVKILSPEGEDITNTVVSYEIKHSVGGLPTLTLEILKCEVEIDAVLEGDSREYIEITTISDESRKFKAVNK